MRKLILLLLAITFVLLTIDTALGCRCVERRTVTEELEKSKAVFSGKVIAEETRKVTQIIDGNPTEVEVVVIKFQVERWWKGGDTNKVILFTREIRMPNGYGRIWSCDYTFKVGGSYLVYASEFEGQLHTFVCSRTVMLKDAKEDMKELGEGRLPENEGKSFNQSSGADGRSITTHSTGARVSLPFIVNLNAVGVVCAPG